MTTGRAVFAKVGAWAINIAGFVMLSMFVTACAAATLNTGGVATAFKLAVQANADNTNKHPANVSFTVDASCGTGQQLVGGGYTLINLSNAHPTQVAIEGNFPSTPNTWSVQARNPDSGGYTGDADVQVMSLAYCVTTPNYDLGTEIVTRSASISKTSGATTQVDVRCSQTTAVALSGGFRTTSLRPFTEPGGAVHLAFWPGLDGTGIVGFWPVRPDASHSSMGWQLAQQYVPVLAGNADQPDVSTTVYAICAQKNINGQAYEIVKASGVVSPTTALSPACPTGEFTVGGGYDGSSSLKFFQPGVNDAPEISGDLATHSKFLFSGWEISGASGPGAIVDALALCIRIPKI